MEESDRLLTVSESERSQERSDLGDLGSYHRPLKAYKSQLKS